MFFRKKIVGLDIGTSTIKLAELEPGRGQSLVLSKFGIYPLPSGSIQGGEFIDVPGIQMGIQQVFLQSRSKAKTASVGLWGNSVIIKKITMPKMEDAIVAEQVKWEAEQYIPFDINEVSLEHHILKRLRSSSDTVDVLLIAAKQDLVFRMVELVEGAKFKLACVDVSSFALANCFEHNYGSFDEPVAILDIGAGITNFVVVEKGEVLFSRDIPVGGGSFTVDLHKGMGVSVEEAEALKLSAAHGQEIPNEVSAILRSSIDAIADEIRNSFEFFAQALPGVNLAKIFFTGGGALLPQFLDAISKSVGISYQVMDPLQKITINTKTVSVEMVDQIRTTGAVTLGLALRREGDG